MKLSQGEYITLEEVENVYVACPVVQQIMAQGIRCNHTSWPSFFLLNWRRWQVEGWGQVRFEEIRTREEDIYRERIILGGEWVFDTDDESPQMIFVADAEKTTKL
ncbi:hypothetical protein BDM02DRAFT_3133275 [Thelephora ganbajun]|uniref:Uncharacterized protein n=1 Tax=Thelephora ganbajun TaxID=370292 RepID=A0ACB6YYM4_THEGA|nr:hypothetical protein BDM02DRAFT_3133275 [Thelephora ganbajun]